MTIIHPDEDPEGRATLEAIAGADRFNDWMYQTIKPYCKGKILEIGSGIGNISARFLGDGHELVLSDLRHAYIESLKEQFVFFDIADKVHRIDLVHPNFNNEYSDFLSQFDTVFALNVVEHIEDDYRALINIRSLLKRDGHVVILVPAYSCLFNSFDITLGHFRRYTTQRLADVQAAAGFTVIHKQYFNAAGIAGWILSGNILRKKVIPAGQMGLYNKLVPIFKIADKVIYNSFGLSAIAIGRK